MTTRTQTIIRRTIAVSFAVFLFLCSAALLLRGGYRSQLDVYAATGGYPSTYNPLFWLGFPVVRLIQWLGPQGPPGTNTNPTVEVHWFWQLAFIGTSLAVGLSLILLMWRGRPGQLARDISFASILLLVLGLSVVNFLFYDRLMRIEAQALLDLVLVMFGSVAIMRLIALRPKSHFGMVALFLTVFLLALEAVVLPAIYGVSFLLFRQGAPELQVGFITAATGIGSFVFTWLTYRRNAPTKSEELIIRP